MTSKTKKQTFHLWGQLAPVKDKLQKIEKRKAGFTLIELIVVMAIIGVLVLLAAPRFLDKTQKAKVVNITNDVKVVEGLVEEYLIQHDKLDGTKSQAELQSLVLAIGGSLYDTTGLINAPKTVDAGPYKLLGEDILGKANTHLTGNFYSNDKGKVYYEDDKAVVGGVVETPIEEVAIVPESAKASATPIGAGTAADPYQIWFLENLDYVRNDLTANYKMMRSLDYNNDTHYINIGNKSLWTLGEGWTPIGVGEDTPFNGIFEGNGKTLTGLFIQRSVEYLGLFSSLTDAEINNFGLIDLNIVSSANSIGGLAGSAWSSTITNCNSNGKIADFSAYNEFIGGLIGYVGSNSLILNCSADIDITGLDEIGGLVGFLYNSTITDSYATGMVKGRKYVGGLLGTSQDSIITGSHATGDVTATGICAGGLIGNVYDFTDVSITIADSYATGKVNGTRWVGGLIGSLEDGHLVNSYATGAVSGTDEIGGLVGLLGYVDATIVDSYCTGAVSGINSVGGLVGTLNGGTITNSTASGIASGTGTNVNPIVGKLQLGTIN